VWRRCICSSVSYSCVRIAVVVPAGDEVEVVIDAAGKLRRGCQ
jgi:hypothetical protein